MADNYINDERNNERRDAIQNSSSIITPLAAGLGAIGLGAFVYKTGLGRVGNYVANTLHYLGHGRAVGISKTLDEIASAGKAARGGPAAVRSLASATYDVSRNKMALGPIDLIDTLRNTLEIAGATRVDVARKIASRVTEFVHRENSGSLFSSFFGHDLQRITVGEVLSDAENWKNIIGSNQWDVLKRSRVQGLVSDSLILDKRIYRNSSGLIRDTRLSSAFRPTSEGMYGGLIGRYLGGIDVFGQAGVIRSIIGSNTKVAALGSDATIRGPRFFINGDVFAYTTEGEQLVASGKKLRLTGDPLETISGYKQGRITKSRYKVEEYYSGRTLPQGAKDFLSEAEYKLGVGFSYATRPSIIERFVVNPIRRYVALAKGEATIFSNPYKFDKASKVSDAWFGGELPELSSIRGKIVRSGTGDSLQIHQLSFTDRLKVLFDLSDEYSVIKTESFEKRLKNPIYKISNKDLWIPVPEGGLQRASSESEFVFRRMPSTRDRTLTKAGELVERHRPRYYDVDKSRVPGLTNLSDFANYLLYRVNNLASESLLGIGFSPGKTLAGTALKLGSIPLIYEAGREALEYTDYLLEEATGFSPKKAIADVYAGLRVAQQNVRSAFGIQQGLSWLEQNYPGSVNSEAGFIGRSLIAPAAVLSMSLKSPKGFFAGAVASALTYLGIGGPSPDQSPEDLEKEYSGQLKVPVRRSRLWGLGTTPLFGGRPEYYDYSWYHKLKNDASYVGTYGSKEEYFRYNQNVFGIPLPTPSNMFGLNNILSPYRWEEQNYYNRPYSQTGGLFEEVPIVGPLLSGTIGKILKPTRYRTPQELPLLRAGLADRGLQPATARMLGIPSINATEQQIEDPYDPLQRLKKFGDVALEPMGLYKFVMEFFGVSLSPSGRPREATSDIPTSEGRLLYGKMFGGALGETEFIRRFLLSEYSSQYSTQNLYNPISNTMPGWLPGSAAQNFKDQSYFVDFSKGDPYLKLAQGESRLPGKLYDILSNRSEGDFDLLSRFEVLADVAPYSNEYSKYEKQLLGMNLDEESKNRVLRAIEQKNKVAGVDDRYLRQEDVLANLNEATISKSRKAYDFFTHDLLAELPILGSKVFPFRNPYEQYRKESIEGANYANWNYPWQGIARPAILDMAYSNPVMGTLKGAVIGAAFSGPLSLFNPIKSLAGSFQRSVIAGSALGGVASTTRILSGTEANAIPSHVQQEDQVNEYADKFTYLKNRIYQEAALESGNSQLASQFGNVARRTVVGANNPILLKSALPSSSDRRYFSYFMTAPGHVQSQFIAGSPGIMRTAMQKYVDGDYASTDSADQETLNYFSYNSLPTIDYVGWNPDMPSSAVKMHMIQHGINGVADNIHRFGFFESQSNELKYRLPDLYNSELRFDQPMNFRTIKELGALKMKELRSSNFIIGGNPFTSMNRIESFSTERTDKTYYMQDYLR